MKAERKKDFEPILITVETEDEAMAMWHMLNQAIDLDAARDVEMPEKVVPLKDNMWAIFDAVYRPKRRLFK